MFNKIFTVLVFVFLCAAHTHAQEMQAIRFDGMGSYVELPSGIFGEEGNATIEAWVKWEQFNEWSRVFDFGREGNALSFRTIKSHHRSISEFGTIKGNSMAYKPRMLFLETPGITSLWCVAQGNENLC